MLLSALCRLGPLHTHSDCLCSKFCKPSIPSPAFCYSPPPRPSSYISSTLDISIDPQTHLAWHPCGCYLGMNLTLSYKRSGFALGFQDNFTNIWKITLIGVGLQQGMFIPQTRHSVQSPSPLWLSLTPVRRQEGTHICHAHCLNQRRDYFLERVVL